MIKVHHLNNSRSQRVLWLLEEAGLDYEVVRYERDKDTMLAPRELKKIHPLGKSPVIEDGSVLAAETGAILQYLADSYDLGALNPASGTPEARAVNYWMHYAEGSAMPPMMVRLVLANLPRRAPFFLKPILNSVVKRAIDGFADPRIMEHVTYWERALSQTGWFAGSEMTLADIMMSFPCEAVVARMDIRKDSPIRDFVKQVQARPAYQRALEKGGPYDFA